MLARSIIETIAAAPFGARVACFGSRETPVDVLALMEDVGAWLARRGLTVASGHCDGADLAFERGCCRVEPARMRVCLPWRSYNDQHRTPCAASAVVLSELSPSMQGHYYTEASRFHPNWEACSPAAKSFHARNMLIAAEAVLGIGYLNERKRGGGGSGQCWRVLGARRVPRIGLHERADVIALADAVKALAKEAA